MNHVKVSKRHGFFPKLRVPFLSSLCINFCLSFSLISTAFFHNFVAKSWIFLHLYFFYRLAHLTVGARIAQWYSAELRAR
jgi:hypothetical protein